MVRGGRRCRHACAGRYQSRCASRLLELPGIGPETADDILVYVFERPVFVVDAYARRDSVALRLGEGRRAVRRPRTRDRTRDWPGRSGARRVPRAARRAWKEALPNHTALRWLPARFAMRRRAPAHGDPHPRLRLGETGCARMRSRGFRRVLAELKLPYRVMVGAAGIEPATPRRGEDCRAPISDAKSLNVRSFRPFREGSNGLNLCSCTENVTLSAGPAHQPRCA